MFKRKLLVLALTFGAVSLAWLNGEGYELMPHKNGYHILAADQTVLVSDSFTYEAFGATSTRYKTFANVKDKSEAVYAGDTAAGTSSNHSIQFNDSNEKGIVSTASGGYIRKILVDWNSATSSSSSRAVEVYASNEPYTSPSDAGDADYLGKISHPSKTEFDITGSYKYVAVKGYGGAVYLDSITFVWEKPSTASIDSVTINGSGNKLTAIGETLQLEATVLPSDASQHVLWESDNPSVASVDGTGLVRAGRNEGTAIIKAVSDVDSTKFDTYKVTVDFNYEIDAFDLFVFPDDFPSERVSQPTFAQLETGLPIEYQDAYYHIYEDEDTSEETPEISIYEDGYIANAIAVSPIARITLFPESDPEYNNVDVSFGATLETNGDNVVEAKVGKTSNGTTYWTYEPEEGQDFPFFKIAASGYYTQHLGGMIIEYSTDAHDWASMFLEDSGAVCGDTQLDHSFDELGIWEEYAGLYELLDDSNKAYLSKDYDVLGGQAMTDIQKAVERYKWIATHYADKGLEPFMDGVEVNSYVRPMNSLDTSDSLVITAGILTLAVLTAGVGYFFYKKRREAQR